jgi:hypothetical protein
MRRVVRWGIACALAVGVSHNARAQDAAVEREAQARFEEGIARVKTGNFEAARVSFLQAYAVLHKPTILWNLALAEEKTGKVLVALGHFREFARVVPVGDDRIGADKHIGELMLQTGRLDILAPAGAQVIVDGAPAGIAPLGDPVDVLPGRHHLEARTTQSTKEADAEVAAGQLVHASLVLSVDAPRPAPALAPSGALEAKTPPSTISIRNAEAAAAGQSSSTSRALAVVLVGTMGVASIGLGAYFALQSQSEASTADGFRRQNSSSYCAQVTSTNSMVCTQWNDAVESQGRDATLSNVFYVAGGVLVAGAVATWFLWPRDSKPTDGTSASAGHGPPVALRLIPILEWSGAGIGAAGSF